MPDTVRLKCLQSLQASLRSIQGGPDATLTFSQVELGPVTAAEGNRKRAVAGIVPGHETKRVEFPLTYCELPVNVEFRVTWNPGDPPSQVLAELVLGDIQRQVLSDQSLGGNAVDLRESSNEIELTIFSDKTVEGVATFHLLYRHNSQDPSKPI